MAKLAIIPARGGSKRIPRKNIKSFLGKPIIAYSIESAIESNLFDEVMVSTDDHEIAEVSKKYGAKVPFLRKEETSGDFSTTFDVIEEVLTQYTTRDVFFNKICCLYPTAPFVTGNKLIEANQLLDKNNFDCVFPIMPFSFPIQRSLKLGKNNKIKHFYDEKNYLSRSQDKEITYHDSGQFYFFIGDRILKEKKILTNNTGAIIIDEMEGQDIDNINDWKIAELKYRINKNL